MIKLTSPFRLATEEDATILAQLVNEAGEGLAEYIWAKIAQASPLAEKPDPWDVGIERQAKMARDGKAIVLEAGGAPVAGLTGYAIPSEPEPIPADMPEMFVPLQELENTVPDTWYINVLATLPEHRGRGYGSELLKLAEKIAISDHLIGLSLIVADGNTGARKLYERSGFSEKDRRAIIRENWATDSRDWILMTKAISSKN